MSFFLGYPLNSLRVTDNGAKMLPIEIVVKQPVSIYKTSDHCHLSHLPLTALEVITSKGRALCDSAKDTKHKDISRIYY